MNISKNTLLLGLLMLIQGTVMSQENLPTPYVVSNFKVTVTTVGSNQQVVYSDFNLPSDLQNTMLLTYRIAGSGSAWSIFSPTYGDQPEIRTLPLGNTYEFGLQIYFTDGSPTQVITPTTPLVPGKYVRSWDANAPEQSATNLFTRPIKDVKQATTYVDGFGRPIQTVLKKESFDPTTSSYSDFVSAIVYDELGREKLKYLPFPANNSSGNISIYDGLLKNNPFQQQASFYNTQLTGQVGETFVGPNQLNWAYGKTDFEPSPLNRVNKSMPPGSSWVGNTKGTQTKYWLNTSTDDVKIWNLTDPPSGVADLSVSIVNNGNGTQTVTYSWSGTLSAGTSASFLDYRTLPSGSWNSISSNAGSPSAPRTYTMPVGNYEYSVAFLKNGTYTQRYLNTGGGIASPFSGYVTVGSYPAGSLYKNVNIDPQGMQLIEFKDKNGKLILKKMQLGTTAGVADDGTGRNYDGWLCTYYIYDDLENLRCVVQPEGVKSLNGGLWTMTTTILDEQCFRYEYDERGRMIMKKVPGAGEVYFVYDARDRLVMTQDANMRATGKWMVTKHDALNRPVETGLWADNTPFTTHLSNAYTSTSYPNTTSGYELLTQTHYDDYTNLPSGLSSSLYNSGYGTYLTASSSSPEYAEPVTQSTAVNGMVTWAKVKVLGTTSQFISSVNIYDAKGRVIQTQSINVTGGLDVITNQYSFSSQLLRSHNKHQKLGGPTQTYDLATKNNYDDLGRVSSIEKNINNTGWKVISSFTYNALGQLRTKKLAPAYNSNTGLETLTYDYNIRGWMLGMNRDFAKDANNSNYFGFDLGYDKTNNGIIGNQTYTNPQYNGNIEGMVWKSKGDGEKRKYDFSYDAANHLMTADFNQYTGGTFNQTAGMNFNVKMGDGINVNSAYDANGNIKRMQQWGWKITGSAPIDDLAYGYQTGSNMLAKVTDTYSDVQTKLGDFHDGSNGATDDYSYDVNGNLTLDKNKSISSITYNYLNLPSVITVTGKGTISYTYDAAGNKLKKATNETNATVPYNGTNYTTNITSTTTYIAGLVYEAKSYSNSALSALQYADKLQFLGHEEGRIRALYNNGTNPNLITGFAYDYMLKDHLGNVRVVLTEEQKQDKYPVASMEDAKLSIEEEYYTIDQSKIVQANTVTGLPAYTNDNGIGNNPSDPPFEQANSQKLYKLNSNTNKTGLGVALKVMAGDRIDILGKSYYFQNNTGGSPANSAIPILELLTGLMGTPGGATIGSHTTAIELNGIPAVTNPISASYLNDPTRDNAGYPQRPRAFINYLFLDEQFRFVDGGFSAVNNTPALKDHFSELQNRVAQKNGYVYIYVSNESPVNVFFDNLQVVHTRGPILEETHYYPFGLIQAGISSKALSFGGPENKSKYNGIEQNNDFDLNMYDAFYRNLDPQIGRFWQIDPKVESAEAWSPYAAMLDNPISYADPLGDTTIPVTSLANWGNKKLPPSKDLNQFALVRYGVVAPKVDPRPFSEQVKGDLLLAGIFAGAIGVGIVADAIAIGTKVSETSPNLAEALQKEVGQLEKSNRSTEKLIREHKEKLQEYKNDPLKSDNKKLLEGKSKEMQQKIIDGRIKKLEKEIQKFENNIEKNNGQIKNIQEQIKKIKI